MNEYMVRFEVSWRDGSSKYQKLMKSPFLPRVKDVFYIDDLGGHWNEMVVSFVHHLESRGSVVVVVYMEAVEAAEDKASNDEWFIENGWTVC